MKCDLHVHSSYSYDSSAKPEKIVETAIKKGIGCLIIADHGEVKGALEAMKYAKGKSLIIIPGIEVKTKEGDVLGINIKEIIPDGLTAEETIKRIKALGGMAFIPHPYSSLWPFKINVEKLLGLIDGIEVLNASIFKSNNEKAFAFAKSRNLPFTCGSDAHSTNFIGRAYLEIPGENLSAEDILSAIKNKSGVPGGKETNFFEKVIDHILRNINKFF